MECHEISQPELAECLRLARPHLGDEIVGEERAVDTWKHLVHSRSFNSIVVTCDTARGDRRVVAFGASVFVNPNFLTAELEHPRPHINSRLIASVTGNCSVLRASSELCGSKAAEALDVVILCGTYDSGWLNAEQVREVEMLLAYRFAECHAGYRLNRLLIETIGAVECKYNGSSGVWRAVRHHAAEHCLFVLTREEAFSVSGSVAAGLFQYQEPTLGLRETDKELLAEALRGGSDNEVAGRLFLSLASVKKRWQMLFERVAETRPDLLPERAEDGWKDSRGPQKRHHILEYVRSHPSELRPFRWHFPANSQNTSLEGRSAQGLRGRSGQGSGPGQRRK